MTQPTFLRDIKDLVRILGDDLYDQFADPAEPVELRTAYTDAVTTGRTSTSWTDWREDQLDQIVTGWVLGTVCVRYAEDNDLISTTAPVGDDRDWWLSRFENLAAGLAVAPAAITPGHLPILSKRAAQRLTTFWQRWDQQNSSGYVCSDPALGTQLLGELYQDLSERARARYSLLQTPSFIERFILDLTLEPAIERFDLDEITVLDPVCGSGTFLLGAFHRLLARWSEITPGMPAAERVRRALASIHGVDINRNAVLITRFRLLVASRAAAGTIPTTPWPLHVAAGDALLGSGDDLDQHPELLKAGRYHVVVGNPPYVTVRDKVLDARYRERYDACTGKYSLTVPFIQLCFQLARAGDGEQAGYVGLLTSNSFTKREFGRRLIEDFLATRVTLTQVVDTSGAFIPGHGAPTLILTGRNRPGRDSDSILVVAGLHGEPAAPSDPSQGLVWRSIVDHARGPGRADRWTESTARTRDSLRSFPWSLAANRSADVMRSITSSLQLGNLAPRIGYLANTGADDVFTAPPCVWSRLNVESEYVVGVLTGSDVRDWTAKPSKSGFFPYHTNLSTIDINEVPGHHHRLWPFRTMLGNRSYFSDRTFISGGRAWYDWHSVTGAPEQRHRRITFAWVATHPHFAVLDADLTLPSAPVVELAPDTPSKQLYDLVALLNSSTVCFWLKQVSNRKGVSSIHQTPGTQGEPWEDTYEYTPARLRELPLPADRCTRYGEDLAYLAVQLAESTPAAVIAAGAPTAERLAAGREQWEQTRARMIALAEEQDWEVYHRYGLLPDSALAASPSLIPLLQLGERAFEIALARGVAATADNSTQWFARHGSHPTTDLPAHWRDEYRELVNARINAIEADPRLAVLERPENKRRWTTAPWDSMQAEALREWLLDKGESAISQPDSPQSGARARPRTVGWLADVLRSDPFAVEAAGLYAPDRDLVDVLQELVADEHVPCVAALRYKESGLAKRVDWESVWELQRLEDAARATGNHRHANQIRGEITVPAKYIQSDFLKPSYWRLRGKSDVPQERFVSYPVSSKQRQDLLLGWAGWSHAEQAQVLTDLVERHIAAATPDRETLVALLAALCEIQPWTGQSISLSPAASPPAPLDGWLNRLHLTTDDLARWRPQPPRRGRPRKQST
ncbi:BREX-2 system adenine-specific DNA-methyltransferase PglX [Dactylosporangium fulvum]|uniref:site-specific DNA-methyltransferase (adenine-specific) n=1 Tax=Dactylosporangium fulvum TaxID=53359 RepID=A0ABY5VYB4_9ACTN|nr:BREX-2 system adenine-specific DNA-methyltransferase PglX [Dactylosporangium fulvum]UWP82200.1 BREX-2 system adenine-specific DNA-methyltransferase PglX [Dactylosporangium fulvum]